ncbi:Response regulator receiver domain-containing protein [Algoriphagus winogradskyi]|uniref:Response regulator receiver domain-containing protein n=2 Tax=Algoriphagus winogradskyi TaxID=237017 RepID=A0ABY1PGQ1_9BACT|nr:Response regulator receiver domain-containing protein [Algoriphagus winogradskyi]
MGVNIFLLILTNMEFKLSEILIIDDDDAIKFVESKILRKMRFLKPIRFLKNGKEGLDFLRSRPLDPSSSFPRLILLDLHMPVLDGWGFLAEFDKLSDEIKSSYDVIIRTSSIDPEDRNRAINSPRIKDFIVKPLEYDLLLEIFVKHGFV